LQMAFVKAVFPDAKVPFKEALLGIFLAKCPIVDNLVVAA